MRTGLAALLALLPMLGLVGCDVFWDARFTQTQQPSTTFGAPGKSNVDDVIADLKNFALQYDLQCASGINRQEVFTCYSNSHSKVSGGFGITKGDTIPIINYRDVASGGGAFFSRNTYCAHVINIKMKLEQFTGPLKMEVSHTGGPPYDYCT